MWVYSAGTHARKMELRVSMKNSAPRDTAVNGGDRTRSSLRAGLDLEHAHGPSLGG